MARLQRIYNDHTGEPGLDGKEKPFFGLVSIGHSFGGAVLLAATSRYFESQLQLANPASGFLRTGAVELTRSPAPTSLPIATPGAAPVGGFGDMVILVNPAVESAAYERINILSRGITYGSAQTPLLVTFSAQNDKPRHGLFKAGRIAGEFFTNAAPVEDDRESASLRESLGVYDAEHSGITHQLAPTETQTLVMNQVLEKPDSQCTDKRPDTFEWWRWADKERDPKTPPVSETLSMEKTTELDLARFDFSGKAKYSDLELKPAEDENPLNPEKPKVRPVKPWQPFLVVSVSLQVIDGHNGIFSEPFMNFLMRYIGLT
ncbi:hypothetical protein PS639_04409 [Pseudomonas fluorescens]|nr:hypothetical protein PS639_04409 [Pseudomonas fluorescens]